MNVVAIIPARMGSTRFPGKPMALINGKPMIGHVYQNVSNSTQVSLTVVATCDKEIFDYIHSIGGIAVMTSNSHERASDRCAEALLHIESKYNQQYDVVVMVQGDEPMVKPEMITAAIQPFVSNNEMNIVNLISKIESEEEFVDPNCIKVVFDCDMNALYFSREPIPTRSRAETKTLYKQVCIIPFKRDYLIEYNSMESTPLEIAESVDMLRVLEYGGKVHLVETPFQTYAVDTKTDLNKVASLMNK